MVNLDVAESMIDIQDLLLPVKELLLLFRKLAPIRVLQAQRQPVQSHRQRAARLRFPQKFPMYIKAIMNSSMEIGYIGRSAVEVSMQALQP